MLVPMTSEDTRVKNARWIYKTLHTQEIQSTFHSLDYSLFLPEMGYAWSVCPLFETQRLSRKSESREKIQFHDLQMAFATSDFDYYGSNKSKLCQKPISIRIKVVFTRK